MKFSFLSTIDHNLSRPTSIFGVKLWVVIIICITIILIVALIFTLIFVSRKRRKTSKKPPFELIPKNLEKNLYSNSTSMDRRLLSCNERDIEMMMIGEPEKQVMYCTTTTPDEWRCNGELKSIVLDTGSGSGVHQYTLREIEEGTNGLGCENVIGSGDYGVVLRCSLMDNNTQLIVKKLFSNRSTVHDFVKEAEAMWLIRHKNLVKLMGYCAEGTSRLLVYEYVENGNLKQWLHHSTARVSPLTWNIRMKIIIGIAKGLAYLHEDTEPAVIHQNLKSSNILLDQQWNPKISDYGITKFLGPEREYYAMSIPVGMSGYIAPEIISTTRVVNEKSDVYSFGILIMEIVSGKPSIESTFNEIEEYLVDWVKSMVADQKIEHVLDPKLHEMPSVKELKRVLLIALRCVDYEVENRPKMGEVIHMLEPRDLLLSDEHVIKRQTSRRILS